MRFGEGVSLLWRNRVVVGLIALTFVAVACGGGDEGPGTAGSGGEQIGVGQALPGPKNDQSFDQVNYEGCLKAETELGVKCSVVENLVDPQARIDALKNLASGNQLVIGVGAEFADAGVAVAPQFQNVKFVIINGQAGPSNLHVFGFREDRAYLAGAVMAKLTKAKKVGYVGGLLIPPVTAADVALKAAVTATDPGVEYVSTIVGDFNDAPKAKEAAAAQIAGGVDVIYAFLDAALPGVEQAIQESGKDILILNNDVPHCDRGPNYVGTAYVDWTQLNVSIVKQFLDKSLPAEPIFYGVEDPALSGMRLCPGYEANQAVIDDIQPKLASGEIVVPQE
jgi:basic membrane protein A and related proteins